jgi:hypothetical protein
LSVETSTKLQTFDRIVLHQRHVLVGGRVIERLDAICGHDAGALVRFQHRAEAGDQLDVELVARDDVLQFLLDPVEGEFGYVEQDQARGLELNDLAAELGADRAAGPAHHHVLALDTNGQQCQVGRHHVAAEQVLNLDLPDVLHPRLALDDAADRRRDLDDQRQVRQAVEDLALARRGNGGHGQQHRGDVVLLGQIL